MEEQDLAVTLARGRIAFGVVSLLAPGLLARMMTGGDEGRTRLFVRMIGARDLGVGLGLRSPWTAPPPRAAGSKHQP